MTCLGFCRLTARVCVLALVASSIAQAGPGDWSGQGPFGGSIGVLQADPTVPTRVYAVTSNGFFRSDDAGTSWAVREAGLLDAHPTNGVFAVSATSSGTLWMFDDAGRLYGSSDGANNWLATGFVLGSAPTSTTPVGLAAGVGNVVWLAANSGGLQKSTNSGVTFSVVASGGFPVVSTTVTLVATNPHDVSAASQHVIASTTSNCDAGTGVCPIYVSADGGATWTASNITSAVTQAGSAQRLTAVAWGPGGNVYALYGDPFQTGAYLLRSSDNGANWSAAGVHPGRAIAASPTSASTVWMEPVTPSNQPYVPVSKSIDSGSNFTPLPTTGRTTNGAFVPGASAIAVSPNYPATPRLWVGTQFAGMFLSTDDGTTWTSSSDGIAATDIRAVVVHPVDNTRIFAGYGDSLQDPSPAFYRSTSIGTWTVSNTGLNAWQLRTIMIDPTTAGTVGSTVMFAVGSGYDTTTTRTPNTRNSGIYKSVDGGLTWSTQSGGIPISGTSAHFAGALRTIIADPRSCAGGPGATGPVCTSGPLQTLYVTGGGRPDPITTAHPYRVLKSTDGGATWADSSTGLPNDIEPGDDSFDSVDGVTPIVMDPSDSRILYIGTFASACDAGCFHSVTPQSLSGVYKSTNSGATWTRFSNGLPTYPGSTAVYDTLSLAIDANNPQTLWVSTISANFDAPGVIYKTINGGANWFASNAGITGPDVRALLADPTTPGTIYAASGGLGPANPGGVYKSIDGGATWLSMSVGLPAFSALSLALDPVDSTVLYAGTTGGVYSIVQLPDGDSDGVPNLIENSGPNGGDANSSGGQDSTEANVGTTAPGLFGTFGWQAGTENASQAARGALLQQKLQSMNTQQLESGLDGGYFTVQVNGGCAQAVDVAPINPGPLGKDSVPHHGTYTYPRGLLRFELPLCDAASVDVIFNAAAFGPGWSWRFYGPSTPGDNSTMGWHDATSLLTNRTATTWTMTLTKGQYGSYRPFGTGSILFEGGPAYAETIFNDKFE